MSLGIQPAIAAPPYLWPRYRYVMAGLIVAAHFALGINFFSVSALMPLIISEYQVTSATASLLVAVPVLAKASIGLPGSIVVNRLGLRTVFTLSWFLMGALALSSLAPDFGTMLFLRLLYGIGAGLMMPAIGPLVMQWFPAREIPLINTLNLIVMSLGIAVSVAMAAPLLSVMNWTAVLSVFGGFALAGAVAWQFLGRTRDEYMPESQPLNLADVRRVLFDRTIFLLVVGDALVFINYAALTSWLPTFFHDVRGMTLVDAGRLTGLLPFVGMLSVLVGGFLVLKVKSRRLLFIIPGIMVGIGSLGTFLLTNPLLIAVAVMMVGVGTWIYQPILLTLPMQLPWMTPRKIAIVWGASLTIAGLGMFISPIVVGASRDLLGSFVPGFAIWAALSWALLFSGLFLPRSANTKSYHSA